jgi:squalene-hopene/tetraprenyl-beta-curcumene cyclase
MVVRWLTVLCGACAVAFALANSTVAGDEPQYAFGHIRIPKASADEPVRDRFTLSAAVTSLAQGARAWNGSRKCISCPTNGTYMLVWPALIAQLGRSPEEMRDQFVTALEDLGGLKREELRKSDPARSGDLRRCQARGVGRLRDQSPVPEYGAGAKLMFDIQLPTGTWGSADRWPQYESDAFHLATVAAMAVADAPGWHTHAKDPPLKARIDGLKHYRQTGHCELD